MFQFTSHKTPWHHCRPSSVDILSSFDSIITVIRWIFVSYQLNNNTLSQESRFLGTISKCFTNKYYFSEGGVQRPPGYRKHIPEYAQRKGCSRRPGHSGSSRGAGGLEHGCTIPDQRISESDSPHARRAGIWYSILEGQFLGPNTTLITKLCLCKSTVVGTEVFTQCILW